MDNVTPGNPPGGADLKDYNYLALVLGVPLILVIILGNVLVCLSVLTERSLKTATNYFIISLAVADLLLAVLVLPLYVYSEFLGGVWTLNTSICDALMTMDVMLCTASILNLCAISVDRYIAVVVPLKYNRNQFSVRQLVLIAATWVLSLGVASPVIFGLNRVPGRDPSVCKLEDDRFVVYSSVCSFFVPCPIMLFLYYWMFRGLRRWSSRSQAARGSRRTLSLRLGSKPAATRREEVASPVSPSAVSMTTQSAPTPQQDRAGVESDPMTTQMDSMSDGAERREEGSGRENGLKAERRGRREEGSGRENDLKAERRGRREEGSGRENGLKAERRGRREEGSGRENGLKAERRGRREEGSGRENGLKAERRGRREEGSGRENGLKAERRGRREEGSGRENGLKAERRRNSKSSRVSGRERKAMKVLPVVVGVFLACWTPFFVVHVSRVLCRSCSISPSLVSVVTWLGYLNSAVNPLIYTAFNPEFRTVVQRLLCCQT